MSRRAALAMVLVSLLLAAGVLWIVAGRTLRGIFLPGASGAPAQALVVVLWPGVGAGELPVYGARGPLMPHLGLLARGGLVGEAHVPSCEGSAASLATLFTGLAPTEHGLGSLRTPGRQRLPRALPTLAERLSGQGWRTLAAVGPAHLAAELTGLERGFDTWLDPSAASAEGGGDPFETFLAELEQALRAGRSALAVLCEVPPGSGPQPRGARAASQVRQALAVHGVQPELRALLERLRSPEGADGALDELDQMLLRRRGDPAREALVRAYRNAELETLDARLWRVMSLLDLHHPRAWTLVVSGLAAAPLGELEQQAGAADALPTALRSPLVVGGRPNLEQPLRLAQLTRDLDLSALLFAAAQGPHDGAPIPWRAAPFDGRPSEAAVHGSELVRAALWRADTATEGAGAGRLVLLGPGRPAPAEPWAQEAAQRLAAGGRYGAIDFAARGLAGREVVARSLDQRSLLHVGAPGAGHPRVVVRLGLEGEDSVGLRSERRAPALVLRLPLADESQVWLGGTALRDLDAPLLPAPDGAPWPLGREPAFAVRELGGGRLALSLAGEPGVPLRLVLELVGPDPYAELPELTGPATGLAHPHPRRPLAREVEGEGRLEFELLPPRGSALAVAAFVGGVRLRARDMRFGERAFAGEQLELALTPWAWSDPALLGPGDPARLGARGLLLALSDPPPPGGEVHPLSAAQRILVARLPEHE